jgi:hypothetical protein
MEEFKKMFDLLSEVEGKQVLKNLIETHRT